MELKEIALNVINEYLDDYYIKEYGIPDLDVNVLSEIAEAYDYICYGGDGFGDNALVLNVKGRPDITNEDVLEILRREPEELEYEIQLFADILEDEIPNFTIRGRMGGYWGISKYDGKCVILNEKGKNELADLIINEYNNMDHDEDETVENALYELVSSDYYFNQIASDGFDLKPEVIDEMKNLSNLIDAQEKDMNTLDFWMNEEE